MSFFLNYSIASDFSMFYWFLLTDALIFPDFT